jgi:hypothetical protein
MDTGTAALHYFNDMTISGPLIDMHGPVVRFVSNDGLGRNGVGYLALISMTFSTFSFSFHPAPRHVSSTQDSGVE